MLANVFCHKHITQSLSWMHKKTRDSLASHVSSLLSHETSLYLSSIGRNLLSNASEKSKINMTWRFLCNERIQSNIGLIYRDVFKELLSGLNELIIAIDWSGCCGPANHLLRASLVYEGRSITLYNEVHPQNMLMNEEVHKAFLLRLHSIIPPNKTVVIITDAGFKTPLFYAVEKLGWYFIGRIRGKYSYQLEESKKWLSIDRLYSQISPGETHFIGTIKLGKKAYKTRVDGILVMHWDIKKGRKSKSPRYPDAEKRYSKLNSEPWFLFSNLNKEERFRGEEMQSIVALFLKKAYTKRMQIEQNFRDDKNVRYGFGWRLSGTKSIFKINILLLIATIASFILWMIGFAAEKRKLHRAFQANTIQNRRVLSFLFLARKLLKSGLKKLKIRKFKNIIKIFQIEFNEKSLFRLVVSEESQK